MRHVFPPTRLASGYVCLQCRHRGFAVARKSRIFPSVSVSFRQYASSGGNENSLTERIRRRLWKTEPPGQKDPYNVDEGNALRTEDEQAIEDDKSKQDSQAEHYVEATTWDGLERIGGPTGWWEEAWDKVNQFEGWDFLRAFRLCKIADVDLQFYGSFEDGIKRRYFRCHSSYSS